MVMGVDRSMHIAILRMLSVTSEACVSVGLGTKPEPLSPSDAKHDNRTSLKDRCSNFFRMDRAAAKTDDSPQGFL